MFNCVSSELVVGKQTIVRHSVHDSDIVKKSLDLLPYPKVGVLNDG